MNKTIIKRQLSLQQTDDYLSTTTKIQVSKSIFYTNDKSTTKSNQNVCKISI
jgi:hypothetical protein